MLWEVVVRSYGLYCFPFFCFLLASNGRECIRTMWNLYAVIVREGHGQGMASVNQTRPHCVNQMGKTHSKPLAARHGRRTAWARHAMCESALRRRFAAARLLRLWVRIPPGGGRMDVSVVYFVR